MGRSGDHQHQVTRTRVGMKHTNYMKSPSEKNPVPHTRKIKARMGQLIVHLRKDIEKVAEPKVQALFETSAEVLTGLVKAFDDYEKKNEAAWRTDAKASGSRERSSHAPRR
jgi:hypothetical protein